VIVCDYPLVVFGTANMEALGLHVHHRQHWRMIDGGNTSPYQSAILIGCNFVANCYGIMSPEALTS